MTFRIEKKLFIKKDNLLDFKEKILSIGTKDLYKSRKVQSIYFDNMNKDMYNDSIEGLNPRKKIRVRNYPDNINKYFLLEYKISSIEGRFKVNKEISQKRFDELKFNVFLGSISKNKEYTYYSINISFVDDEYDNEEDIILGFILSLYPTL